MKIIVRIGVTCEVESYADAGNRVDQLVRELEQIPGVKARITGFETRPCQADEFEQELYSGACNRPDAG